MRKAAGICIGSSTVSCVYGYDSQVQWKKLRHFGNPQTALREIIQKTGIDASYDIVATGRSLRSSCGYYHVSEPEAIQRVIRSYEKQDVPDAIVSFGGQTILVYELDSNGQIVNAYTFNKCGSGTGEFFLQQIKRLGFCEVTRALEEASQTSVLEKPYVPASRCSVFCKSDCTHATNEGKASQAQIVAGLCKMIAEKISELLSKIQANRIWIIGGGSNFHPVLHYLAENNFQVKVPERAEHFEAWGAKLIAQDIQNKAQPVIAREIQRADTISFPCLPPLKNFRDFVEFRKMQRSRAKSKDRCILAIDVGSTTTKLVLARLCDLSIVASYYGYTQGQPAIATHKGLENIQSQIPEDIEISGICVTGSGRYLVEAYLTDFSKVEKDGSIAKQVMVANEISCHAKSAEHFNPGVNCVLEIGGQDAKYTYLVNGVPTDFCMNEACSAGTGSFLAEVVKEMFGINQAEDIAPFAMEGISPIQFGEQCSAFIESDINVALQEKASPHDIVAGLCYSICYNYINRVVGPRPIFGTISLQGGTAYNEAFCYAMAGVLRMNNILGEGEKIVVSKDAGLMGAIGAFLLLKVSQEKGDYLPICTSIETLLGKKIEGGGSFECRGCDYKCVINNFVIDGVKVPFGGFCRKYDSIRKRQKAIDPKKFDYTCVRDDLLFRKYSDFGSALPEDAPTIGLLGNFFELTYLPFFSNFFTKLGYRTILADAVDPAGVKRQGAAFCWPVERAHGLLYNLKEKNPDFFWLPHLKAVEVKNVWKCQKDCCPFVQASPYYLAQAFPEILKEKILAPYLDLSLSLDDIVKDILPLAEIFGVSVRKIDEAARFGWQKQEAFSRSLKMEGKKILEWLSQDTSRTAFVIFGRPYNAFSAHLGTNKGISRKIASLGIPVIPLDLLPGIDDEKEEEGMYWTCGQHILRGAKIVERDVQLFGVYFTNFSCGPDSFINFKFRHYMGQKPSLTLEFDGHTANAGFDTRIEAFFDIVKGFRKSPLLDIRAKAKAVSLAYTYQEGKNFYVVNSSGERFSLKDARVRMVLPDMGRYNTEAISSVFNGLGIQSLALPPADEKCLQLGRRYSSCKECLPYNLTLGSLLAHIEKRPKGELTVFFMPEAGGPCRFGQYNVFMKLVLEKIGVRDVALISFSPKNSYNGVKHFSERTWIAVATASCMEQISNALDVLAISPDEAKIALECAWARVKDTIVKGVYWKNFHRYLKFLKGIAQGLSKIPLKYPWARAPKILLSGEIYIRLTELATKPIVQKLSEQGFIVIPESALNWTKYIDLIKSQNILVEFPKIRGIGRIANGLKMKIEDWYERAVICSMSNSALMDRHVDDVAEFIEEARPYLSPKLGGEAILTIGGSFHEVFKRYCGVVVIGPFGCMPTRIASSILSYIMTSEKKVKRSQDPKVLKISEKFSRCPVLFVEADGNPLPPITLSQMEVFSVVAKTVGQAMSDE